MAFHAFLEFWLWGETESGWSPIENSGNQAETLTGKVEKLSGR